MIMNHTFQVAPLTPPSPKNSTDTIKMESMLSNSLYMDNIGDFIFFRFEMASSRLQRINPCLAQ